MPTEHLENATNASPKIHLYEYNVFVFLLCF